MAETFMIKQLTIKSKIMMKLGRLRQEKEILTQLISYFIINTYWLSILQIQDPRAIQQTEFYGKLENNSQVCTGLEKSKETALEFYKGTANVL